MLERKRRKVLPEVRRVNILGANPYLAFLMNPATALLSIPLYDYELIEIYLEETHPGKKEHHMEKRRNWKENIGKAAKKRADKHLQLLVDLDTTRHNIQSVGLDFPAYDKLKEQQRYIIAKLATL